MHNGILINNQPLNEPSNIIQWLFGFVIELFIEPENWGIIFYVVFAKFQLICLLPFLGSLYFMNPRELFIQILASEIDALIPLGKHYHIAIDILRRTYIWTLSWILWYNYSEILDIFKTQHNAARNIPALQINPNINHNAHQVGQVVQVPSSNIIRRKLIILLLLATNQRFLSCIWAHPAIYGLLGIHYAIAHLQYNTDEIMAKLKLPMIFTCRLPWFILDKIMFTYTLENRLYLASFIQICQTTIGSIPMGDKILNLISQIPRLCWCIFSHILKAYFNLNRLFRFINGVKWQVFSLLLMLYMLYLCWLFSLIASS